MYKIKIRGLRASITRLSNEVVTEEVAKNYIEMARAKFRNQITSCLVFTNAGKFIQSFNYLLPTLGKDGKPKQKAC